MIRQSDVSPLEYVRTASDYYLAWRLKALWSPMIKQMDRDKVWGSTWLAIAQMSANLRVRRHVTC